MNQFLRRISILVLLGCLAFSAGARPADPATDSAAGTIDERAQTLSRLDDLQRQIRDKEKALQQLRRVTRGASAETMDAETRKQLNEIPAQLDKLNASFESVAVGGMDLSSLSDDAPQQYDWEAELVEIVRPVIGSMKSLTEKPRKIEALRQGIQLSNEREETLVRALDSLAVLRQGRTGNISRPLQILDRQWQAQLEEARSNRQLFEHQLKTLEKGDDQTAWQAAQEQLSLFLSGRGVTLGIVLIALIATWLLTRLTLAAAMAIARKAGSAKHQRTRERAMRYLHRLICAVMMLIAVITVFYLRSDMLLLALTIIGIVMTAAALRQTIPSYVSEIRILLGFGSVREGERMMFNGIPMHVRRINAFARLQNPSLDGSVRVPIGALNDYSSRPVKDECWFPTEVGDFVLFNDRFGQVLAQSIEKVRLRTLGSPVDVATADFLGMSPVNLSREGFLTTVQFGIDYAHQPICLDEVPDKMRLAIEESLQSADWGAHCESVNVEFCEAAASSLDYLALVRMKPEAAASYFAIRRRIQQALVAVCNKEQWSIPFGQLTIHAGAGFSPSASSDHSAQADIEQPDSLQTSAQAI